MKTKINNEEFKNYGDGSIAFKMRAKGVHYTLHFFNFDASTDEGWKFNVQIRNDWSDLEADLLDKSLFGLFNQICKFFGCTIVKFQETLPIVDEALRQ